MDVRDNLGFLLYLDRCSLFFQHYTAFPLATATGILQAYYEILVWRPFYSVCISGWPLLRSFRSLGEMPNSSKAPPLFKWLFLAAVSQLWHIKASSWCGRTCIPKSAPVRKGDLQWQVSYRTVSFSWMAWLIKFNVEQELAYILPGLRSSYSHLT